MLPDDDGLQALSDLIIREALATEDLSAILARFCSGLAAAGLPLQRVSLSMPRVDPNVRAITAIWTRTGGTVTEEMPHGPESDAGYAASPIYHLLHQDLVSGRYRLSRGQGVDRFPLLAALRSAGATDYYLRLIPYPTEQALRGLALSVTSDAPEGFSQQDIGKIERLLPVLALAAYRIAQTRLTREVLGFYLGTHSSERVLAGEIQRGSGQNIRAAILFADVRHFTAISEANPSQSIIAWLNELFERIGRPIEAAGGEVLKFLGDGLLAIFPLSETEQPEEEACARALAAAEAGLTAIADLAKVCTSESEEAPQVDIALHFGDLFYGNIGAARRLDFTAIGPTVNEAARIEALCEQLGRRLLLSEAFAARLKRPTHCLGHFTLRGVSTPRAVHALS